MVWCSVVWCGVVWWGVVWWGGYDGSLKNNEFLEYDGRV